eukprot:11654112-Heterocapsa_arctica.AAC.1
MKYDEESACTVCHRTANAVGHCALSQALLPAPSDRLPGEPGGPHHSWTWCACRSALLPSWGDVFPEEAR